MARRWSRLSVAVLRKRNAVNCPVGVSFIRIYVAAIFTRLIALRTYKIFLDKLSFPHVFLFTRITNPSRPSVNFVGFVNSRYKSPEQRVAVISYDRDFESSGKQIS